MRLRTQQGQFEGPAGAIEYTVDLPADAARGWALVLHPHPLHGGTRDNKVVTTLARACVEHGLIAVRPNFRGVGGSAGVHDGGVGEVDDMLACVEQIRRSWPQLADRPWVLGGFSFGSAVAAQVADRLLAQGEAGPARLILVGCAVARYGSGAVAAVPDDTVLVHGERDDVVPLAEALEFADQHGLAVSVVPRAGHFFHGHLLVLRQVARAALAAV